MRRVTLKDVAGELGVSKSLVSCAINDTPDGHWNITIKPEVRARIKAKAVEMGYRPHRNAKALREGTDNIIGIVTPVSFNPVHSDRLFGLIDGIEARGYDYLIQEVKYSQAHQFAKAVYLLVDYNVDGIILAGTGIDEDEVDEIRDAVKGGMPVVEVSVVSNGDWPSVAPDYYSAMHKMTRKLIEHGHQKILAYSPHLGSTTSRTTEARLQGIKDACAESKNVQLDVIDVKEYLVASDMQVGYRATRDTSENYEPDLILYSNDYMAIGGLRALADLGIRVPDDVHVCGFDGVEGTKYSQPRLTTIEQPSTGVTKKALDVLYDMIEERIAISQTSHQIPCRLIFRESTGHTEQDVQE